MTVDEFLAWVEGREGRHELHGGHVVAMSPERVGHITMKGRVFRALGDAIGTAGLACHALPDGATVRVPDASCYEPDALVYCGPLTHDAQEISNPIIVARKGCCHLRARISMSLASWPATSVPSVVHYLVIDPDEPAWCHSGRQRRSAASYREARSCLIRRDSSSIPFNLSIHPAHSN
ncbi:MAG: Uma2 family endonuclease [Hyphomicrobiaceae bacterium]